MEKLGKVKLTEPGHRYFHEDGREFISVSKVKERLNPPFNAQAIASVMCGHDKIQIEKLLKIWEENAKAASDKGTTIHNNIEDFNNTGICDDEYMPLAKYIRDTFFYEPFNKDFNELVLYHDDLEIAGTVDRGIQRQKYAKLPPILDIYDYKSNIITFDSIKREKDGTIKKHYNRYMESFLSNTESCKYIDYSNQLNSYGFMAEDMGFRVGKLAIIEINYESREKFSAKLIPVPYYRMVGEAILRSYRELKKLPATDNRGGTFQFKEF